jgi:DNA-binding NtrC family response regulator
MSLVPVSAVGQTRARVLIVEDELFIRLDVSDALREAGFEVIEAVTADDAASLIKTGELLDVVFTDIQLPGELDGLAFAQWLRATRPWLPVVITSGYVSIQSEARQIGNFVPKPYEIRGIVAFIADIVEATRR